MTAAINYSNFIGHLQRLNIPVYDFESHLSDLTVDSEIGRGGTMVVYQSELCQDSQQPSLKVALKMPHQNVKQNTRDKEINKMLSDMRQELRMMKHLEGHPNIVNLYGVAFRDLKPLLIVELAVPDVTEYIRGRLEDGNRV